MPVSKVVEPTIEERRVQLRQAVEQCMELLKRQFGANRVILFGSLAEQGIWHDYSDVDLAVEGVLPADFFKAYSACLDLLPQGLDLDLVPLEDAYPEMRVRILGEVEMPDEPILALRSLVEDELTALDRVAQEMLDTLAIRSQPPTRLELRGIVSLLHEFYNSIERIFERVVVNLGEELPRRTVWHADLLNQIATAQEENRSPVIDGPLHARLTEYMKFRHFFRHAYGYTLDWNRLRWLAEQMDETLQLLREQLTNFFASLIDG